MKISEFTSLPIWRSNEEQEVLQKVTSPMPMESFQEREATIVETLIRKQLLIKVQGKHSVYVYPAT